jgi:hypothetical protein
MAYFPSGTSGEHFDVLCFDCAHGWAGVIPRMGKGCPVWFLQCEWNYSQIDDEAKKEALDSLVPNNEEVTCAMFIEVQNTRSQHSFFDRMQNESSS